MIDSEDYLARHIRFRLNERNIPFYEDTPELCLKGKFYIDYAHCYVDKKNAQQALDIMSRELNPCGSHSTPEDDEYYEYFDGRYDRNDY